ncbi:MAG: hypothetical protein ABIN80_20040 [Dyadobacter sp.]
MKRDDRVYIQDIIDSIEIITDYVNGKSEKDFEEVSCCKTLSIEDLK